MSFNPKRRYSAVAVLSEDLDRVVLIHKLRPNWQAGKANLPGGKVEGKPSSRYSCNGTGDWPWDHWHEEKAYRNCAARELREETGLDVAATALKLFCRLRFKSRKGDEAECCFYVVRGDVDAARTMETERVFVEAVEEVVQGCGKYSSGNDTYRDICLPTMPNLPYLVAMARQCLRGGDSKAWPLTVYENGATP